MKKPNFVTKEHMKFLDEIDHSIVFDVTRSLPVIEEIFPNLSKHQCLHLLNYWMEKKKEK